MLSYIEADFCLKYFGHELPLKGNVIKQKDIVSNLSSQDSRPTSTCETAELQSFEAMVKYAQEIRLV